MMTAVRNAQAAQSELPIYERPESLAADPALAPMANLCVHEAADIDAMRRAGKSEEEIEKLAAARDKAKAEADAAAAEEAKKHTVEYLLEEIKTLLEKQSEK